MPAIIPEVYLRHLEEFQALWEHRQALLSSTELTRLDLTDWERRMRDHLDGLLVPGDQAVPMIEAALEGNSTVTFASAYVLLRLDSPSAARLVMDRFLEAVGDELEHIKHALCWGPIGRLEPELREIFDTGPPAQAAAAAEVLVFHGRLEKHCSRLPELFHDTNPVVRRTAWYAAAILDASQS